MIRKPDESMRPEMIRLWKQTFGDDDAFIAPFFRRMGDGVDARVYLVDGHVVAAAYLVDAQLEVNGARMPMWYEYALATQPSMRGRGLMTALLAGVHTDASAAGILYTALRPASAQLVRYYAKRGYRPYFRSRYVSRTRAALQQRIAAPGAPQSCDLAWLWDRAIAQTNGSAHWSRSAIAFALQAAEAGGDKVVHGTDGFAVWTESGTEATVKLWAPSPGGAPRLAQRLLQSDCDRFRFRLPVNAPDFPVSGMVCTDGMLYAVGNAPIPDSENAFLGMEMD